VEGVVAVSEAGRAVVVWAMVKATALTMVWATVSAEEPVAR
jgi:hypothetical protein